jgi:hypothetical protein
MRYGRKFRQTPPLNLKKDPAAGLGNAGYLSISLFCKDVLEIGHKQF